MHNVYGFHGVALCSIESSFVIFIENSCQSIFSDSQLVARLFLEDTLNLNLREVYDAISVKYLHHLLPLPWEPPTLIEVVGNVVLSGVFCHSKLVQNIIWIACVNVLGVLTTICSHGTV